MPRGSIAVDGHVGAVRRRDDRRHRGADDIRVANRRIADVVVDAFAEPDDRLAPAVHRPEELDHIPERFVGVARLHHALHVERVARVLLAHELVDRGDEPRLAARELLGRCGAPAGSDDRDHVVGADITADELARRRRVRDGLAEVGLEIVHDDEEDTAVEGVAVGADVGLDDDPPEKRRIRLLDRDINARERGDRLRRAALGELEIVLRQIGHELAVRVGHDRIDFDVVHLDLEGRRRLRPVLPGRWRRLPEEGDAANRNDQRRRQSGFRITRL